MTKRILACLEAIGLFIELVVTHQCSNCDGRGTVAIGNEHTLCPVCGGQGRL